MSKQAAILLALGALATAAALASLGAWILLRRGPRPPSSTETHERNRVESDGSA
jgi:hypothetical protein